MPCAKKSNHVSWLQKVQFIRHYAMDTCETPWLVYVEMGTIATTNLVLNLVGISPTEALYTMLRPKGARSVRQGRRKVPRGQQPSSGRRLWDKIRNAEAALPDSADVVAKAIQSETGVVRPVYEGAGTFLFEVAKPFVAVGYYITMFNAPIDFAYDWYSGILLAPESKCALGRFVYVQFLSFQGSHAYQRLTFGAPQVDNIDAIETINGLEIGTGTWALYIEVSITNRLQFGSDFQVFIKLMLGSLADKQCGDPIVLDVPYGAENVTKKVVRKVHAPDTLNWNVATHSDNADAILEVIGIRCRAFRL